MSNILDGKALSLKKEEELKEKISKLKIKPKVVSFLIGNDPPSHLYTQMKQKKAESLGIDFEPILYPETASLEEVKQKLIELNNNDTIVGVMFQLPMPKKFLGTHKTEELINIIDPNKDIDGLRSDSKFIPATTKAVMSLLDEASVNYEKNKFAMIGSEGEVGKSIVHNLQAKGAEVIKIDKRLEGTKLEDAIKADVVISVTGVPNLVKGEIIKEGAVVIDVGIMVVDQTFEKVTGDVDFESVSKKARLITPVPGGVGPVTVISLMENIVDSGSQIVRNDREKKT